MDGPLRFKIDNVHSVVAKLGDQKALLVEVDRHVMDSSADSLERYRRLKNEWRALLICRDGSRHRNEGNARDQRQRPTNVKEPDLARQPVALSDAPGLAPS